MKYDGSDLDQTEMLISFTNLVTWTSTWCQYAATLMGMLKDTSFLLINTARAPELGEKKFHPKILVEILLQVEFALFRSTPEQHRFIHLPK